MIFSWSDFERMSNDHKRGISSFHLYCWVTASFHWLLRFTRVLQTYSKALSIHLKYSWIKQYYFMCVFGTVKLLSLCVVDRVLICCLWPATRGNSLNPYSLYLDTTVWLFPNTCLHLWYIEPNWDCARISRCSQFFKKCAWPWNSASQTLLI